MTRAPAQRSRPSLRGRNAVWAGVLAAEVLALVVRSLSGLDHTPPGLYSDEASIGYNAWAVGHTGRDEHGATFPLYFEAFGEWKNPVYIYVLAGLLRVLPLTVATVRTPAALFGILTALALAATAWRTTRSLPVTAGSLLVALATPWLVLESRLGFELSALLACLALALLGVTWSLQTGSWRPRLAAGIALAVGIYAYSTGRVEIALLTAVIIVCAWPPRRINRAWLLEVAPLAVPVGLGYLLLLGWNHAHPGELTARFNSVSVGFDNPGLRTEAARFLDNIVTYLNAPFLFLTGDANPRHNSQFGGMLPLTTFPLLLAGVVGAWRRRRDDAMARIALVGLVVAPVSAALTEESVPHSLRANAMLPFLLLTMVYGLSWIAGSLRWRRWIPALTLLIALEGSVYTLDLYRAYPTRAAGAFDDGEARAIAWAATQLDGRPAGAPGGSAGGQICLSTALDVAYIQALFVRTPEPPPSHTADSVGALLPGLHMVLTDFNPAPSSCVFDVVPAGSASPGTLQFHADSPGGVPEVEVYTPNPAG